MMNYWEPRLSDLDVGFWKLTMYAKLISAPYTWSEKFGLFF